MCGRLQGRHSSLEDELQNNSALAASEKVSREQTQLEEQQLQHELATMCLCIVTIDVDLSTLVTDTEPPRPLGEPSTGCKLYSRCKISGGKILLHSHAFSLFVH